MNSLQSIQDRINQIESRVNQTCLRLGRNPKEVKLLLASKTISAEILREVAMLGYTCMGENKAQEFKEKVSLLRDLSIEWHFIGHLQTNKIKDILSHTHLLHSLDRISLAEELNKKLSAIDQSMNCLIEVNCSGESSKSGLAPDQVIDFVHQMKNYPNLRVMGLMTLAKNTEDENELRAAFIKCKSIFDQIKTLNLPYLEMKELSMGMSHDFEIAIEEGATLIRIGSAIFGERK